MRYLSFIFLLVALLGATEKQNISSQANGVNISSANSKSSSSSSSKSCVPLPGRPCQ